MIFALFLFLLGCAAAPEFPLKIEVVEEPAITQAIFTIPTRPGVQQRMLMVQREGKNEAILILFPGGDGAGHFQQTERGLRLSNNFLARGSSLIASEGFMAAIVDVPSDHSSGMSDGFRTSPQHLADIRAVVRFFSDRYKQPIFLVGTSRGALSVGYVGTALGENEIRGIIFTSIYDHVGALPLEKIRYPVLFVHHRHDACGVSPYDTARRLYERVASSPKRDFVTVIGGDQPISGPCQARSYHGFLGKEWEVVKIMADWVSGKKVPATIGP